MADISLLYGMGTLMAWQEREWDKVNCILKGMAYLGSLMGIALEIRMMYCRRTHSRQHWLSRLAPWAPRYSRFKLRSGHENTLTWNHEKHTTAANRQLWHNTVHFPSQDSSSSKNFGMIVHKKDDVTVSVTRIAGLVWWNRYKVPSWYLFMDNGSQII